MNTTQKILLFLCALLTLGTMCFIFYVPGVFKTIFDGMGARLPAPTQFIFTWHQLLVWLPLGVPLLVFLRRHHIKNPSITLLIATIICAILLPAFTFIFLSMSVFDSCFTVS